MHRNSTVFCSAALLLVQLSLVSPASGQSGAHRPQYSGSQYGVNLSFAILQYEESGSPPLEALTRLKTSFETPEEEKAYLTVAQKLADVQLRHSRTVGLIQGEQFTDAVLLGPEYMVIEVKPTQVDRNQIKTDVRVLYANKPVVEQKGLTQEPFETVLIRGSKGMFGVKYFVGPGGKQETAPIERTLLVSIKTEVVSVSALHNRPGELSYAVDQYGNRLTLHSGQLFTPPVPLERVVPKFETGRTITGSVTLGAIISEDGKVTNVRVLKSIDPDIDEKAVDAFRQYTFSPALLDGKASPAFYRQEITFARELSPWEIEEQQDKDKEKDKNKKRKLPTQRRTPWPWPPI